MTKEEILEVAEIFIQLYREHSDYTVLTMTLGTNKGIGYERWNIYTPVLAHNDFTNPVDLVNFVRHVLEEGDLRYHRWRIEEAERSLLYHTEEAKVLQEEIAMLSLHDKISMLKQEVPHD